MEGASYSALGENRHVAVCVPNTRPPVFYSHKQGNALISGSCPFSSKIFKVPVKYSDRLFEHTFHPFHGKR